MSNSDVATGNALRDPASATTAARGGWYNAVWRWHFYAGVLCVPFVIWLALTGTIYLWRPQIEAWLDRPYDRLATQGAVTAPDAQVAAALAAVPDSRLHRYVLPQTSEQAVRVLVTRGGEDYRVYLDPRSLAVLNVAQEESRPMRLIFHLHGELMAGPVGSYLVEIAACWAVVMILTGLFLWWPRGVARLAGTIYPRLNAGSRILWRDLHATAGLWVSVLALGLILTGLPWAKGWGSYLAEIRYLTGTTRGPVDWAIGGKVPKDDPIVGDQHAGHHRPPASASPLPTGELARVIATVKPLAIAPPVMIAPPRRQGEAWRVTSDAANRPLRSEMEVDGTSGAILGRRGFEQRHWIDRAVGYGVAVHEGALFGLANQILGTLTALLLVVLAVSGVVMWWRRKPAHGLGAPVARGRPRFGPALTVTIVVLAAYMPMFGATLLIVILTETVVLRRLPGARVWLGLGRPADLGRI